MNRVAVITGATRGLGLATAKELQARGFSLILIGREKEMPPAAALQFTDKPQIEYISGDITQATTGQKVAEFCREKFGRLDLLVNNAGIFMMGSIEEFEESAWDKIMGVNLKGGFLMTKVLVGLLKESKGQIVFINSVGGKVGLKNLSAYSASKFGLLGLADSLRLELKPAGVRVTSIFPHGMNSAGELIAPDDPKRLTQIETADVARMIGEIADAPVHVQIPELVIYPRSTEISKRET